VAEEMLVHERMVGLGMLARDADVFVLHQIVNPGFWERKCRTSNHVERNDVFERDLAILVRLH
jgi:hypothetical protein